MMLIPTEVRPSSVEGLGVFTVEPVKKGTLIWKLDEDFERLLSPEKVASFPPHMKDYILKYCYPHPVKKGYLILEVDNGRFMNHSLKPNTDFSSVSEGYAIRNIDAGEELLSDYNEFDPGFELV